MSREETVRLLTEIAHLFPRFVNADEDKKLKIELWNEALGTWDYQQIHNALMIYVQTEDKGFAPSVGQLIELSKPESDPLLPRDNVFMWW